MIKILPQRTLNSYIKFSLALFLLAILTFTNQVFAESEFDNYSINYEHENGTDDVNQSDTDKLKNSTETKTSYSLYYENLGSNIFIGYTPTVFFDIHNKTDSWGYLLADLRLGYIESDSPQEANSMFGTVNLGMGASYGFRKHIPLSLYTEVGIDLLESIANIILSSNSEDSEEDNHNVFDIDAYFALGISLKINKKYTVSLYSKLNDVSGYLINDHSGIYYGGKITIFY